MTLINCRYKVWWTRRGSWWNKYELSGMDFTLWAFQTSFLEVT